MEVSRRPRPLKTITPSAIAPTGASIVSFTEIESPAAMPAMISGPRSSRGASGSGVSCTAPAAGARRWWPLIRKATKAIRKAKAMMSLRPSPGWVSIITPESRTIAAATREAGPTL